MSPMANGVVPAPDQIVSHWLSRFEAFARSPPTQKPRLEAALEQLFIPDDGWWRDHCVCSWDLRTSHTVSGIARWLLEDDHSSTETCKTTNRLVHARLHSFRVHQGPHPSPIGGDGNTCPAPSIDDVPFSSPDADGRRPKVVSASFRFQMGPPSDELSAGHQHKVGVGRGALRLLRSADGEWKAWTFFLVPIVDDMRGRLARPTFGTLDTQGRMAVLSHAQEFGQRHTLSFAEERARWKKRCEEEPAVVVVGGGHSGLATCASLMRLGVPTLLIERSANIGDVWTSRYSSLTLHTARAYSGLPHFEYPSSYPRFLPKDLVGEFFQTYADTLNLVYWTSASFVPHSAFYDDAKRKWRLDVLRDGPTGQHKLCLTPNHLVLASGIYGPPRMPRLPGSDQFEGRIFHSQDWPRMEGKEKGRKVIVVGCGNTGSDICNDNANRGAEEVTMVQRSIVCVQSAGILDKIIETGYPDQGRSLTDSDFLSASMPLWLMLQLSKKRVESVDKVVDAELHNGLRAKGLKTWLGPQGAGGFELIVKRGGGFWWDAGCGDKIVAGRIGVKSGIEVERFTKTGVVYTDGEEQVADDVIFCTGYETTEGMVLRMLGPEIASKVSRMPYVDDEGEYAGVFRPTGHQALWVAAGTFSNVRQLAPLLVSVPEEHHVNEWAFRFDQFGGGFSQALQIKAVEEGVARAYVPCAPHNRHSDATENMKLN